MKETYEVMGRIYVRKEVKNLNCAGCAGFDPSNTGSKVLCHALPPCYDDSIGSHLIFVEEGQE